MLELNLILALVLKPMVIVVDDVLLFPFWKMREKPGMIILFWSTIIFLLGELTCAIDVYIFQRMTLINEGIHDTAMLIAFGGFFWGFYKVWVHKYGCFKPECEQYKECELEPEICGKNQQCGIYPVWILLGGVVFAVLPIFSTPIIHQAILQAGYGDIVIGTYFYNRTFNLFFLQQILFPISAIVAFIVDILIVLSLRRFTPLAWKFLFFGMGALGFVYFRLMLINIYHPNVVYTVVGEEILELLFMILLSLWIFPKYKRIKA